MRMQMEWTDDMAILHIVDRSGRVEVRGSRSIFTDRELVDDPIVMFLSAFPRLAINRSALMADEAVGVRREFTPEVRSWLEWYDRVTCWFDGKWSGK